MIEIGAGGGSIAKLDGLGQIAVGPESAGADPGPACYGRDGQDATVTDANVVLGKIAPEHFAGGKVPILPERAAQAVDGSIGERLGMATPLAAFGVTEMVDENMANAARVHAIESGKVIGDHTIIAFGGGAPLHAARLAEKLGISRIIVPTEAGVGSAVGFLRAPVAFETVHSRYMTLRDFDPDAANEVLQAMQDEAYQVVEAGAPGAAVDVHRSAFMRYEGQGHEIVVDVPDRPLTPKDTDFLKEAFDAEYSRLYARNIPDAEIEILTWAVVVSKTEKKPKAVRPPAQTDVRVASQVREIYDPEQGEYISVSFFWRPELKPGDRIKGPALIAEEETSTLVATDFDATILGNGFIDIRRRTDETSP
ncbi:MAG: hypothetical protein MJE12_18575 [Alphaproteobacteria bacterium]|nr:hypothetical protein [Alphaproteobacteria bacterium]